MLRVGADEVVEPLQETRIVVVERARTEDMV